jgi:hypothetical protein
LNSKTISLLRSDITLRHQTYFHRPSKNINPKENHQNEIVHMVKSAVTNPVVVTIAKPEISHDGWRFSASPNHGMHN